MSRILRAWFGSGSREVDVAGPATYARILEDLRECVVENSEGQLSANDVDIRACLYEHGYVDSLSAASLLVFIHQRYQVEISGVELAGRLNSLDALARHLQEVARVPA